MKAPSVREEVRKMALKLLEIEFIKDAWSGNYHYPTKLCLTLWRYADKTVTVLISGSVYGQNWTQLDKTGTITTRTSTSNTTRRSFNKFPSTNNLV